MFYFSQAVETRKEGKYCFAPSKLAQFFCPGAAVYPETKTMAAYSGIYCLKIPHRFRLLFREPCDCFTIVKGSATGRVVDTCIIITFLQWSSDKNQLVSFFNDSKLGPSISFTSVGAAVGLND